MSAGRPRTPPADGALLYVVPYLNDPAVQRRLRLLRLGGMQNVLAVGFRRTLDPVSAIDGVPVIDLGRTRDGKLARRVLSLAGAIAGIGGWADRVGRPAVIMARSLEALLLARAYRYRTGSQAPLVYESLDIHGALLGQGAPARALRLLEARSLARSRMLITSSPAFVSEYFRRFHTDLPEVAVLENRMLASEIDPGLLARLAPDRAGTGRPAGPPWTIGWFGLFRCRRSLELLAALCRRFPGEVRVELRGRPAATLDARFGEVVASTPGLTYHGPYDRGTELGAIYSEIHFSWTLDYSESGGNSDWLLPNRLYEAGPFGCVPLASATAETGRWLARHDAGQLLAEPVEQSLPAWFGALTAERFAADRAAMQAIPLNAFIDGPAEAAELVERLRRLTAGVSAR